MVPKHPFEISLFRKRGQKNALNHENQKTKGTFTLTTFKIVRVKVVLFFSFSNV